MSEIIKSFGIDWKLLLAQVVNFFILLYILRRFIYKPVSKMMGERKREIEKGLQFSKDAEEQLRQSETTKEKILKEARGQGLKIVSDAESNATLQKSQIVKEANRKKEEIILDAKRAIDEERAKMGELAYQNAGDLVRLGIVKVLGKMGAKDRDEQLIKETLAELKSIKSN